jgi:hypothetical protein
MSGFEASLLWPLSLLIHDSWLMAGVSRYWWRCYCQESGGSTPDLPVESQTEPEPPVSTPLEQDAEPPLDSSWVVYDQKNYESPL